MSDETPPDSAIRFQSIEPGLVAEFAAMIATVDDPAKCAVALARFLELNGLGGSARRGCHKRTVDRLCKVCIE